MAVYRADKGVVARYIILQLDKKNNSIKNEPKTWIDTSQKEDAQMANKHKTLLSIINHWGSHYNKIPLHTYQNGWNYFLNDRQYNCRWEWRQLNSRTLLGGYRMVQASWSKHCLAVSHKVTHLSTRGPVTPLLSTHLRWVCAHAHNETRRSTMGSCIIGPNCKPPNIHQLVNAIHKLWHSHCNGIP